MPRRIADYPDAFSGWNHVSSMGSYVFMAGLLVFFFTVYRAFATKTQAGDNPWGAGCHSTLAITRRGLLQLPA